MVFPRKENTSVKAITPQYIHTYIQHRSNIIYPEIIIIRNTYVYTYMYIPAVLILVNKEFMNLNDKGRYMGDFGGKKENKECY